MAARGGNMIATLIHSRTHAAGAQRRVTLCDGCSASETLLAA
jgi:hypothetical protein